RLRRERPHAHVTWLCGRSVAPLVEQLQGVDEVLAIDERRLLRGGLRDRLGVLIPLWWHLGRGRFTHVLLLHADFRYRVLTLPVFGAKRVGQSARDAHGAMNPIPGRYFGDEYARLLDGLVHSGPLPGRYALADVKPMAESTTPAILGLRASTVPRVALVPGGTRNVLRESVLRRWPIEHYVELARALADDGCEVVLVGDAGDDWV